MHPLPRALQPFGPLSDEEQRLLEEVAVTTQRVGADHDLLSEGDNPSHCLVMLDGFACDYRLLADGRRQIVAFHVPTSVCGLPSLFLNRLTCSTGTLTPATVLRVPCAAMRACAEHSPRLGEALWRAALVEAAASRAWIANIGQRTAYQRTANLLCELVSRLRAAGLADGFACPLPLTQADLADALGLTAVQVNRTVQQLRSDELILFGGGVLAVRNWRALRRAGGFDPAYLGQPAATTRRKKAAVAPRDARRALREEQRVQAQRP